MRSIKRSLQVLVLSALMAGAAASAAQAARRISATRVGPHGAILRWTAVKGNVEGYRVSSTTLGGYFTTVPDPIVNIPCVARGDVFSITAVHASGRETLVGTKRLNPRSRRQGCSRTMLGPGPLVKMSVTRPTNHGQYPRVTVTYSGLGALELAVSIDGISKPAIEVAGTWAQYQLKSFSFRLRGLAAGTHIVTAALRDQSGTVVLNMRTFTTV